MTHDKAGGAIQQMVSVIFLLDFAVSLSFLITLKGLTWFFSLTMKGLAWAVQGRLPKWSVLDCSQRWWMAGGKVSTKGEEKYKKLQNYEKGMKIPKLNTKYKTIVGLLSALQYLSSKCVHCISSL